MKYKLIIFDFDGTLVDTAHDIGLHANQVLKGCGFKTRSLDRVKDAIGQGVGELLTKLAPEFQKDPKKLKKAVAKFKKIYTERPAVQTVPFPGVRDVLDGPLRRVKKAIVTNKPQGITEKILRQLSMDHYFDLVIGEGSGRPRKPNPISTIETMERLGVIREDTIYVGDSEIDFQTALRVGIDFAWVNYGYDQLLCSGARTFSNAIEWSALVSD